MLVIPELEKALGPIVLTEDVGPTMDERLTLDILHPGICAELYRLQVAAILESTDRNDFQIRANLYRCQIKAIQESVLLQVCQGARKYHGGNVRPLECRRTNGLQPIGERNRRQTCIFEDFFQDAFDARRNRIAGQPAGSETCEEIGRAHV